MQKIKVEKISPLSLGKALALVFFGFAVIAAILGFLARETDAEFTVGAFIQFTGAASRSTFVLLLVPFLEALYGFITGILIGWLYNFAARKGAAIEYVGRTEA